MKELKLIKSSIWAGRAFNEGNSKSVIESLEKE